MEKENKRKRTPNINEELMMSLMVDGVKTEGLHLPLDATTEVNVGVDDKTKEIPSTKATVKEKSKAKRSSDINYESIFFKKPDTNARDGKTVYIRPDFHEKMSRIVQVIGEDKLSIYGYLDNLLDYHFKEFGEQIIKSFNEKYKPIL